MALEKREKTVGGMNYSILLPPPTRSMSLCSEAAVLFGPIIGGLSAQAASGGWELFSILMRSVEPGALDRILMRAVMEGKLTVDGTPICDQTTFDLHFTEFRSNLYPVCFWALWESVKDFFPADLANCFPAVSQILTKASQSQTVG